MNNHIPIPPPKWLQRHIRNTLTYYPKTGDLIWTNPSPQARNIQSGDVAGSVNSKGYLQINFRRNHQRIQLLAHHIAWFLYYGEWPHKEVDHQDTVKTNNRIRNLRSATASQAARNRGLAKDNSSGVTGVGWNKKNSKWYAQLRYNYKTIHFGLFVNFNDAVRARRRAEKKYFGRWRYSGKGKVALPLKVGYEHGG